MTNPFTTEPDEDSTARISPLKKPAAVSAPRNCITPGDSVILRAPGGKEELQIN